MSILINPEVLSHSYLPEKLLYRNNEKLQLLTNVKNSVSTFFYGPCGSGKTSLIKQVAKNFNSIKEKAVYIDCCLYHTTNSILREALQGLGVPVFCRSNYDLLNKLKLKMEKCRIIICLDHFEKLKEHELIDKLLSLSLCVIVVSDAEDSLAMLSPSARSCIENFNMPKYSNSEAFGIIKDRAQRALKQGCYNNKLIKKIVDRSNGNIGLAINMLKSAALRAESENRVKIEEKDIPVYEPGLNHDERILLRILKQWKTLPASKLYDSYIQDTMHPKGDRSFRNYMKGLHDKGMVRAVGEKRARMYEMVEDVTG